jgi:hypothetical protein
VEEARRNQQADTEQQGDDAALHELVEFYGRMILVTVCHGVSSGGKPASELRRWQSRHADEQESIEPAKVAFGNVYCVQTSTGTAQALRK